MENKEQKRLHLTLTDNRTGQTIYDADGDTILGAFCMGESDVVGVIAGKFSPAYTLGVLGCIDTAKEKLFEQEPEAKLFYELFKTLGLDKKNRTITEFDMSAFKKSE